MKLHATNVIAARVAVTTTSPASRPMVNLFFIRSSNDERSHAGPVVAHGAARHRLILLPRSMSYTSLI